MLLERLPWLLLECCLRFIAWKFVAHLLENCFFTLQTFQEAALIPLREGQRRIAFVGDIMHAEASTEQSHCLLGTQLASMNYDMIVAVGEKCHDLVQCVKDAGYDESHVFHFADKDEADLFVQHELKPGDLVVIKGSKEAQFETVVKELMAFPLRAKEDLLQR